MTPRSALRPPSALVLAVVAGACASAAPAGGVDAPAPAPAPASVEVASSQDVEGAYDRFAREFLDWYYEANPIRATGLGIHRHDAEAPDRTRAALEREAEALHGWLARLEAIPRARLQGDRRIDHEILENAIRAQLLELEEVRGWEHDPIGYVFAVSGGASTLASRDFAPVAERMRSMIPRLRAAPAIYAAGRANVDDVPRLWAERAIRSARGTVSYLRDDLPAALADQGLADVDPALRAEWDAARAEAISATEAYAAWLESDLLPRADGDFRLGRDLFERKVRYEEFVDLSADRLRAVNEQAIRRYRAWVEREAARIDPSRDPAAIMDSITSEHPSAEELIETARGQLEGLQRFVVENEIVTLPSDGLPTVRETPEYDRSGFASMSTPGPFETRATEAYYNITNVDPSWTEEQKEQHLTYFNYPGLLGITIHEAMPGHFVQLLYEQQIPTEVRKVFTPASLTEGWAHYAEQMMVDEGLGGGDPAVRLGQLRRALQRHARWYAGLEMHAFGEEVDDAAERFQEIAYFAAFPARRETERGTYNPTYLYYALGRMQILKLREDYRAHVESQGREFSLREFHDRFLRLGLPVALARRVMIPGDERPSL